MNEKPLSVLLKTFPHTRYYPEWRLLTWHPRALFDDALARAFRERAAVAEWLGVPLEILEPGA